MASIGRVVQACERCRRQKLKCDATRPCTLCLRAGTECKPRQVLGKRKAGHEAPLREPTVTFTTDSFSDTIGHSQSRHFQGRAADESIPASSPTEHPQFGANSSVINFARNVARDHDLESPDLSSTIPGDAGDLRETNSAWGLRGMQLPAPTIMRSLIQAYFDRVQWFVFLFHEPTFIARAEAVLCRPRWTRQELPDVVVAITVAAMGLQCVLHDSSWPGHRLLEIEGLKTRPLLAEFIAEIRMHLMDLVDDGQIETTQVCLILGTYYIYNGSAHAAWSILSLAVSTAYALALHCESSLDDKGIAAQTRRRSWNHVIVADTFSSMIYGRPPSLDAAFARIQPLLELDDTAIDGPMGCYGDEIVAQSTRSTLAFHVLKYRLYSITKEILSKFRLLRLSNPLSEEELVSLVDSVRQTEHLLSDWRSQIPDFLTMEYHNGSLRVPDPEEPHRNQTSPAADQTSRTLMLQAITLQITYDSSLIFLRRPLIEHTVSMNGETSGAISASKYRERSLDVAIEAALRISHSPLAELENHLVLSFVFMHFFTAGVILCIVPPTEPFSARSQECKSGVMRIIRAGRAHGSSSKMAKHLDELLTPLLSATIQRELNNALDPQSLAVKPDNTSLPARPQHESVQNMPLEHNESFLPEQTSQFDSDTSFAGNIDMPPPAREFIQQQFPDDMSNPSYQASTLSQMDSSDFQFDAHLDETFGAFGQMMFNLLPDDPYSPWNWGGTLR